jgi:ATP-dependent helicase HepA
VVNRVAISSETYILPPPIIGGFVTTSRNRLGVGKLANVTGDVATVQYFKSVAESFQQLVPRNSLLATRLASQTRCYLRDDAEASWSMGRIGQYVDRDYEVSLPGYRAKYVPEANIYVRCSLPLDDPTDVLALKAHETPFFQQRRLDFYRSLLDQRAAFRGMAGLASSRINLLPHQVNVAERVLHDPVQRYLLADEVGLGKTIEAGIILRQLLLDQPNATVLIWVPPHIVDQWQQEIEEKFAFGLSGTIEIWGTDKMTSSRSQQRDLLILDEAQLIAANAWSTDANEKLVFTRFMEFSKQCKRLLLLSATPVLNNERDFLAMLHMLDPTAFKLEDFREFRTRVEKRQDVGRALLSLRHDAHPVPLRAAIKSLRQNFEGDAILVKLAEELQDCLGADASCDQRNELIHAIRVHISETYRLHRRVLRHRRHSLENVILFGRGDESGSFKSLIEESDSDERLQELFELLENWRVAALGALPTFRGDSRKDNLKELYFLFLILADASLSLLHESIKARIAHKSSSSLAGEIGEPASLLWTCPLFEGEDAILEQLERITGRESEDGDRLSLLVDLIRLRRRVSPAGLPKIVVFSSFERVALRAAQLLQDAFGKQSVAFYTLRQNSDQIEDTTDNFRSLTSNCNILVCDRAGEVGRNLQFADVLIHLDLPWSPNRIEQRIGRLDRIGRTRRLSSHVFVGPDVDDTVPEWWYRTLKSGFGVFNESIASLQMFVDQMMPRLISALWEGGPLALKAMLPQLQSELAQERIRIAEQDALDHIESNSTDNAEFFKRLEEVDGNSSRLEKRFDAWVVEALNFKKVVVNHREPSVHIYKPKGNTLVPADLLSGTNGGDPLALTLLEPKTFRRANVLKNPALGLLRIGEPFVDSISQYIDWDDRGKACASWRHLPYWEHSEAGDWMGFRFVFFITADCGKAIATASKMIPNAHASALLRQGDFLFAPFLFDWVTGIDGEHIVDTRILEAVSFPFKSGKRGSYDWSLANERLEILSGIVDSARWPRLCYESRVSAEGNLRADEGFRKRIQDAASSAHDKLRMRTQSLELRVAELARRGIGQLQSETKELNIEKQLAEDFLWGIHNPLVRLDSIAFFVLSGRRCPGTVEPR